MIYIPNKNSIIQKIFEYKKQYIKDHGKRPTIIYLDPEEREDLRKAVGVAVWIWPVTIAGMKLRKQEDYINMGGFMVKKLDVHLRDKNET